MSDLYQFDYNNPKFDQQKNQWYWEGRRADTGKKIRKYANGQSQTPQYDANQYPQTGYASVPYDATTGIQSSLQGMSLQEQPVDQYGAGASNYATWQAGPQTQGYQEPAASNSEQSPQSRLISRHGKNPAVYGDRGDAGAQDFEQRNGGYVAAQRPAQDASLPEPNSSGYDGQSVDSGYYDQSVDSYGTSKYGQWMNDRSTEIPYAVADETPDAPQGHPIIQQSSFMDKVTYVPQVADLSLLPFRVISVTPVKMQHSELALMQAVPPLTTVVLEEHLPEVALALPTKRPLARCPHLHRTPDHRMAHTSGARRVNMSPWIQVFKVMWTEPLGEKTPIGGGSVITEVALQDHKNNVWTGFRRFIVVGNDEGHCTCVPILTYGNQGCQKRGVKPHKHGIVYEQGTVASELPNEPKLGFQPICMQMTAANEHISHNSRVNYSKLVSVEHNVKVFFIGRISYDDWPTVQRAVDKCWEDQLRERPHHISRRGRE
ncbi:hypothetical protein VSDG_06558 [Cytospora chrysosperma]|uniref:DUF6590 domain-containing protein n=1 Tax=Cytospora chrysosperma TaxID=252740 RepID=A0A423VNU0_CYTCH|nr:hypothetical protein VSDG_06558 [Valsa sordida]